MMCQGGQGLGFRGQASNARPECAALPPLSPRLRLVAPERRGDNFKHRKHYYSKGKAGIWPRLSYLCHIRSTAVGVRATLPPLIHMVSGLRFLPSPPPASAWSPPYPPTFSFSLSSLSSLKLNDTNMYEPQIRALLGTTSHFCEVTNSHDQTRSTNVRSQIHLDRLPKGGWLLR